MTLQKRVLLFVLLYCLKCCFKLYQCKELIILKYRQLRTEYCSESLLLVMAFKTVKQKNYTLHQYVYLYSLHYYRWIFRTDRNYCSNCQKGKNDTQIAGNCKNDAKSGNQFCSACSFDLSTFRFLKSISYCQPPKKYRGRQYYSAGAYSHFCLLLNLQINLISTFSQHISSAVSHHMLLFPQLFVLFD